MSKVEVGSYSDSYRSEDINTVSSLSTTAEVRRLDGHYLWNIKPHSLPVTITSAGDPGPSMNGKGFYHFSADRRFILIDFVHLFTSKNWCPLKGEAD